MTAAQSGSAESELSVRAPLIPMPLRSSALPGTRRERLVSLVLIALLTMLVFGPTLRNGFLPLGFDDALITDTQALRALTWPNLWALFTEFNHAHYVPLTMLSLAVDYHFWGLNPVGYHLTNVLLHALTAMLVCVFLWRIVGSVRAAVFASLIFALHPVQVEAVSVAIQRKSVLSGVFFFLTFITYCRWDTRRQWRYYALCLLLFAAAALAKPTVVTLPCLLLLYDYVFGSGRLRVAEKAPFFGISAFATLMAVRAHAAVAGTQPLHGGNELANLLMVSRVTLEYVDALFLPLNLSPVYYYRRAIIYSPINFIALCAIVTVCTYVTWQRRRYPWSFFCLWWLVLALLPESNLVPLAQLRADRFLYLGLMAFGVWVAIGLEQLAGSASAYRRISARLARPMIVACLAVLCFAYTTVWRSNVSAWRRVVDRHPWCAVAHDMLGRAYYGQEDSVRAEWELKEALRLPGQVPDAYLYLAKVYADRGQRRLAQAEVQRFLALSPGDSEGLQLLTTLKRAGS